MRRLRTPSILGAMIAGVLVLSSTPALAEVSIAVGPALLELEGRPGDVGHIAITVSENGSDPVDIVTGLTELTGMMGDHSAVAWSAVTPTRASLQPGDDVTLDFQVTIPDDAPSGGRYATITITTAPPGGPDASVDPSASTMLGRIEVPVFLTVVGDEELIRRPLAIERTALFLGSDGTLSVVADVSNGGNVHVPLTGRATVTEPTASSSPAPSASPLAETTFPMGRVLPETTRTLVAGDALSLPLDQPYDLTVEMGPPTDDEPSTMREVIASTTQQVVATASMSVSSIDLCRTTDGGHLVTVSLVNDGGLGLTPDVALDLLDATGASVANARVTVQQPAWPGATVTALGQVPPGMPDGTWSLVAQATYGDGLTADLSVPFVVGDSTDAPAACPVPEASPAPSPSASPVG